MARKSVEQNHVITNSSEDSPIENIIEQQNLTVNENISFTEDDISENKKDNISENKENNISENNISESNEFFKRLKLIKAATYYSQGIVFRKNQIVTIKDKAVFDKLMSSQLFEEV